MNLKEYFEKIIEEKRSQISKIEGAIIESDNKEERAELGETLKALKKELDEAEKALEEVEKNPDDNGDGDGNGTGEGDEGARSKRMTVLGTYQQRGAEPPLDGKKEYKEVLEKRGQDLREKRAIQVSTGKALLPTHEGTVLNDTFSPVSTLVDVVATENLQGGESYKEAFVKEYKAGGITKEGADYTEAEPVFEYAPMTKQKITAYAEISEEIKKLPNIDYASKVEEACLIALKKKLSEQMLNGTGTEQIIGISASPIAINAAKDVDLTAIDNNTLNEAIFNYGGDEEVETEASLVLNKKTLKALAEVRNTDGKPAYEIDVKNKTINTIPYVINSNVKDFATAETGDFVMYYGDLRSYKIVTFSPVEIMESTDFKFKQGMICFKASVFVAGNVVRQDGVLRLKKK